MEQSFIIKNPIKNNFTIVPNWLIFADVDLNIKQIILYLLQVPNGWKITQRSVASTLKKSPTTINKYFQKMYDLKLLTRHEELTKNGKIVRYELTTEKPAEIKLLKLFDKVS